MNPFSKYALLGGVIGGVVLLTLVGFTSYNRGKQDCESAQILKEQKALEKQGKRVEKAQVADLEAAKVQVIRETKFREIRVEVPQIVNRDVYVNVCADADGVRILQAATNLANGETTERANGRASKVSEPTDEGKPRDR
jgi:hypothetical protein